MLRPLLRGTLYYTGMAVLPPFAAWHVPYISDGERLAYLTPYERGLAEIEQLEPLCFPSLNAFDDRLYPKG